MRAEDNSAISPGSSMVHRRRISRLNLQTIILISVPALLFIIVVSWLISGSLTGGTSARVRELIFERSQFSAPITLLLPAEDDRKRFEEFSRAKNVNAAVIIHPFGLQNIQSDVLSFLTRHGYAKAEKVTVQRTPGGLLRAFAGSEEIGFLLYTEKLQPFIVERSEGWPHGTIQVRLASRRLESIDYTNQYEGSPMGIKVTFYAMNFSYSLDEKLPGLPKVAKRFKGSAKAYLDPDDGQWKVENIELEDSGSREYLRLLNGGQDTKGPEKRDNADQQATLQSPKENVNDFASIIVPTDMDRILEMARGLEKKTTIQLVVVTVNTTKPDTIESFATKLGNKWGIGRKGEDNGVLFVIAVDDRAVRIAVGYGLERAISSSVAKRIIDDSILPHMKTGDYSKGVLAGVEGIYGQLFNQKSR